MGMDQRKSISDSGIGLEDFERYTKQSAHK